MECEPDLQAHAMQPLCIEHTPINTLLTTRNTAKCFVAQQLVGSTAAKGLHFVAENSELIPSKEWKEKIGLLPR